MTLAENAQLALDTILQKPVRGIPSWLIHPMEHRMIDRLADVPEGTYLKSPVPTYLKMQGNVGTCLLDQWIPENPLSMGNLGYENGTSKTATTGAERIICDGIVIDSPEAVVKHLEQFVFPSIDKACCNFDEDQRVKTILKQEQEIQSLLAPTILKGGYDSISFPCLAYYNYGYENYFTAYAWYPDVIEKHFALQADYALLGNRAAARAYREGNLPPFYRLDHDMADSRGTLVDIKSLDKIWFPHFARCLEPVLKTDLRLIWHCDGNLSRMIPRLLQAGLRGFQGFQYEDGMDYKNICRMKDREGRDLLIIAGVSVTRSLPNGTPADVRNEMKWLVDNGPKTGLFLGCTSSIAPGVPWENLETLVEGFKYYRQHGRG